ncbi:MAG: hypothetical protein WC816_00115 [Sphingomonas sp.]|jgi:hypothetical protein
MAQVDQRLLLDGGTEDCGRPNGNLRRFRPFVGKPYTDSVWLTLSLKANRIWLTRPFKSGRFDARLADYGSVWRDQKSNQPEHDGPQKQRGANQQREADDPRIAILGPAFRVLKQWSGTLNLFHQHVRHGAAARTKLGRHGVQLHW